MEGHFESITVEVDAKQCRHNLIISEIYRVPNTNERTSIERYDEMVTGFGRTKCDIIIGSDLNLLKMHGFCWALHAKWYPSVKIDRENPS